MKFNIESIAIHSQTEAKKYPKWKIFIAKLLKLELVQRFDVHFKIKLYKNCLLPNHHIQAGNNMYLVISQNLNDSTSYLIKPHTTINQYQVDAALQCKEGRIMFHSLVKYKFKLT